MSASFKEGCTGKLRYETDKMARRVATAVMRRPQQGNRGAPRAYKCPHCRGWHISSFQGEFKRK